MSIMMRTAALIGELTELAECEVITIEEVRKSGSGPTMLEAIEISMKDHDEELGNLK